MLGFLIGTLCLIGLIKVLRHGHGHGYGYGYGYGPGWGWGGHGCHGHGCHGGGRWARDDHDDGRDREARDYGRDRGPAGGFGGPPGFGFGRGFWLRGIFERLDTTPGQEKVILQAVDEVREAMHGAKHEWRRSRSDVAAAFGKDHFDAEAMGAVFSQHDDAIASVRKAVVGAMSKVHEVLDERQRRALAEILESRFGGRFGFGGPYRGGRW